MPAISKYLHEQLDFTCQRSKSKWAAWVWFANDAWQLIDCVRLTKNFHNGLDHFLETPGVTAWLGGARQTGRIRSRKTNGLAKSLGCQRIYSFAPLRAEIVLIVGSDGLSADQQATFQFIAKNQALNGKPETGFNLQNPGRQARNLEFIHKVLTTISCVNKECEIAQCTTDLLADYFGYELSTLLVPDASGENLVEIGLSGPMSNLFERGHSIPVAQGIVGKVFRIGESYISNNVDKDPDYLPLANWSARTEIAVPLQEEDQIIGVINLEHSEVVSYLNTDLILLKTLAGIVSNVMMNARRNQLLEDKIITLQTLREFSLDIVADLDFDTLLMRIVHRACELVHAKGAEIGLLDDEQQGIRVQTSENPWYNFSGHFIPIGTGIAGQILLNGQPVRISNYNEWTQRLNLGVPAPFKAAAGIPLRYKKQVIGTIVVMDDRPDRTFSEEDVQLLEMVAQNIALAIHNAQLYRELEERSEAQRQAESRLIQSERMATAGRLTASIAHEINNPLQALQNCLYLAERTDLAVIERQKYLAMARCELDRLGETVHRMLDFYRPGVRDRQLTDLNLLISRMIALVEPNMTQKKIHLNPVLSPNLPLVMVEASQIQQVLLNLVLNSMEAMPDGGEITIQSVPCDSLLPAKRKSRKPSRPVGVEIFVRDTGPGIPLAQRDRIFEPFISTKENGTGLGLSVSYGIIQAHGGVLSLVIEDQQGACFRIALPEEKK